MHRRIRHESALIDRFMDRVAEHDSDESSQSGPDPRTLERRFLGMVAARRDRMLDRVLTEDGE